MSSEAGGSKETIAIMGGTGDLGLGLALRWAAAGVPVVIGSRDESKAQQASEKLREQLQGNGAAQHIAISGLDNAKAAATATVVVLTVPFPAQAATLKSIRDALKNSTMQPFLVDATVPLAATVGGKPTRMLGIWEGSAAEQARGLVPANIPVLAAFHNASAEGLQDLSATADCDILVCGDDPAAKQRLFPLVELIPGLRPIDAGPLEMARIVESITALLISINRRYKVRHSGLRISGLGSSDH